MAPATAYGVGGHPIIRRVDLQSALALGLGGDAGQGG